MCSWACYSACVVKEQLQESVLSVHHVGSRNIYITQVHQAYWQAPLPTEPSSFHLFNISLLKGTLCVLSSLKTRVEKKTTLGFSKPPKSWLASSCSGGRFEQPWWLRQQQLFCLVPPSALVAKISVPKTFQCQNSYSQYPQWNCSVVDLLWDQLLKRTCCFFGYKTWSPAYSVGKWLYFRLIRRGWEEYQRISESFLVFFVWYSLI